MKKIFILLSLSVGLFAAQMTMGQITGSAHDFSGDGWSGGEICIPCHTPHNAMVTPGAPLWNHALSATATYTLYTSPTLNAVPGQPIATSSHNSKLCLACHDGTVALENFGGVTTGTTLITGDANFGINLSNDHPIAFTYDAALATADGGLWDPTTTASGLGGTISDKMLFAGTLQCASCHDVHNAGDIDFMLLKSNAGSALCLTCHNK